MSIFNTLIKNLIIPVGLLISAHSGVMAQQQNNVDYEIYVSDTLILTSDFLEKKDALSEEWLSRVTFKPSTDGYKKAYFINGQLASTGEILNGAPTGVWTIWHPNGVKAREGEFIEGRPHGTHHYWYNNEKLRAIGQFNNGVWDGKWEMYNEEGGEQVIQYYKEGVLQE